MAQDDSARETESVGSRLRRARLAAGLSQTALAGEDLSPSYISHVESGRREPTPGVVALLAARLGVHPSELSPQEAGPEAELVLAQAALGLGNAEEALALLVPFEPRLASAAALAADPQLFRGAEVRAAALERLGRLLDALRLLETMRLAADSAPTRLPWVGVSVSLIRLYRESGDIARAVDIGEAALRRGEELGLGGVPGYAALVSTVAGVYAERGDLARAQVILDDLIDRLGDASSADDRAKALWNAALNATERGYAGEGLRIVEQATALAAAGSELPVRSRLRYSRAWIMLQQTPPLAAEARAELRALLPEARQHTGAMLLGPVLSELARAELLLGRPEDARQHAAASLEALGDDQRLERAHSLVLLGAASVALGEQAVGVSLLEDAADSLQQSEASRYAAQAWRQLAEVYQHLGDQARALEAMERALDLVGLATSPVLPVSPVPAAPRRRSRARV